MPNDPGSILGQAASLDPAIRDRVIALANLALDEAEHLIKFGDPIMKGRLVQSFMVTFSKHMRTQDTDDELEKLRNDMEILRLAVIGRRPGDVPESDIIDAEGVELEVVEMPQDSPPMLRRL